MDREVVKIGDCDLAVDRFGKGAPLVVLHGEDGPRRAVTFCKGLAAHFEVHLPYLAGWPDTRRAPYVRTARDLALVSQEYIERFKQPVPVVGLSFGGWIAAEIAATTPALVSSLVLVSPIGVKIGGREEREFADLYLVADTDRLAFYYAPGRAPTLKTEPGFNVYLEKAIADEAIVRYCWQPYMHDPGLKHRLRRIQAATLLVSGGRDSFVLSTSYYEAYSKLIPGARHEVIAAAGHRVEEEEPQKVAEGVIAFVAAAAARTAA